MSGPVENPAVDMLVFERRVHQQGFQRVAGIDEAGRGPLAGPVVAAAVILPPSLKLPGVRDSKMLSAAQRECCLEAILATALDIGIGCVDVAEIDRINILKASFRAMLLAIKNLQVLPDFLLVDGPYTLPVMIPQQGIVHGDQLSLSIAAASIVAKVHRDRLMQDYHRLYPIYGFDRHKGYATQEHIESLRKYGACPIHRMTFKGVTPMDQECIESGIPPNKGKTG
jgi:ribonuclease HII